MVYISVEDIEGMATKIQALGGKTVTPIMDIPKVGRILTDGKSCMGDSLAEGMFLPDEISLEKPNGSQEGSWRKVFLSLQDLLKECLFHGSGGRELW
jgi:hypothetical protein